MEFYKTLEMWYLNNKRDLPWRKSSNPYFVWLSEIILQQTRIQQGLSYYNTFTNHYPTVLDLANAKEDNVLKNWQGLGYYSRARNLHFSAKYICNELDGKFPTTYKEIIKLKGVGDYTASAIASICFNEKTAVVDGNVYRVLSRYFNIDIPINSSKGIKYFKELAQELIINANPKEYNQAIMDFGSMVCKPQNPNCENCPLENGCLAKAKNMISSLPVKEKKIKIKNRYLNFIVFTNGEQTILEKRTGSGIWQNLYQFPLLEFDEIATQKELIKKPLLKDYNTSTIKLFNPEPWVHKLSHQHLFTQFWIVDTQNISQTNSVHWENIDNFAVPKLIHKFLDSYKTK
ncbi:A/G-specific adenine glycosylase [Wenyingzhuangia heitensis]|uniref:Adenine DNA glycosylase n=1 Tax=Wenyingzhuangia heitensis TaxID=1487859 RepID=A0ABX0U8Z6_9FLAO|nr:A/G-specific adenine glycosylase [Wenyingzhuangia heitensis]NIJ43976.1 A/G-specific adenine glycosylase [Wenyingzhuangia heitensis]